MALVKMKQLLQQAKEENRRMRRISARKYGDDQRGRQSRRRNEYTDHSARLRGAFATSPHTFNWAR